MISQNVIFQTLGCLKMNKLENLLKETFPSIDLAVGSALSIGCCQEWDSMGNYNFLLAVEDEFDVRFTVEEMTECKSLLQVQKSLGNRGIEL